MVSAGYNASGHPLPGAGLGVEPTANIGLMVSQQIPFPGKRDLRGAMASRNAEAELKQVDLGIRRVVRPAQSCSAARFKRPSERAGPVANRRPSAVSMSCPRQPGGKMK